MITRHPLAAVLAGGFVLQLLVAALPGFPTDIGFFHAWATEIAADGPGGFYAPGEFHDYPPGYMWILWLYGEVDQTVGLSDGEWEYLLKLPSIVANVGSAYVLHEFLAGQTEARRLGAAGLWLIFPPALLIGPVWGQVDAVLAFFILLTIYLLARRRPVAAALAFTTGLLVKPQAVAALPFILFWFVRDHPPARRPIRGNLRLPLPPRLWLTAIAGALGAAVVIAFPFFPSLLLWRPLFDLAEHLQETTSQIVPVNSFFAYNLWELLDISGRCDRTACEGGTPPGSELLGLTTRTWGLALFALTLVATIAVLRDARGRAFLALGTSLSMLAFFAFMTRMHERYLFPFFLPFLAACVLIRSRALWAAFAVLATANFLNLYVVYANHPDLGLRDQRLYEWLGDRDLWGTGVATTRLVAFFVVAAVPALVYAAQRVAARARLPSVDGRTRLAR